MLLQEVRKKESKYWGNMMIKLTNYKIIKNIEKTFSARLIYIFYLVDQKNKYDKISNSSKQCLIKQIIINNSFKNLQIEKFDYILFRYIETSSGENSINKRRPVIHYT